MSLKMMLLYSKPLIPMTIGLCLGIALSLICAPFMEESCDFDSGANQNPGRSGNVASRKTNSLNDKGANFDYGNAEDFEPKLRLHEKSKSLYKTHRKLLRPRYISTELSIREKLFVGVLTSRRTVDSMGVAVNRTLTHYVPKLVFFMDNRGPTLPPGMSVVSFSDERPNLKPFHMFKYIKDHYLKAYDWYLILPDNTYTRGEKIFDMISHMSISQELHLGKPEVNAQNTYCGLGAGIIISQSVMSKIVGSLDWCMQNAYSLTASENIGRCILHAAKLACVDHTANWNFTHYSVNQLDYDNSIDRMRTHDRFNKAVTVHQVPDEVTMYKLHRYYCELDLNQTMEELGQAQESIVRMSPLTPGGKNSATWPIGVQPKSHPKSRFDVIRWDYFTKTHIFFKTDQSNIQELEGVDKQDVTDVVQTSMKKLKEKYQGKFIFSRLVNGYRRFDPARGMEYTLDLSLKDTSSHEDVIKRVHLVRPLSHVEIVPMPYVTENSRVNLILPVNAADRDGVVSFLDSYAHTCLDSGDNTDLFVIFIYDPMDRKENKDDIFAVLKSMITYYENKYQNGARIAWTSIHTSKPTQFTIMDAISKKFPPESLFFLCTVGMELSIEFLNRVRMNTIANWQVFFPVGFWQYKPNLIYDDKPYPTNIDINKNVGHFDRHSYYHTAFYNADYSAARNKMKANTPKDKSDLFDLFLKFHNVHVFRAVEPALKHRYRPKNCNPTLDEDAYQRCLASRAEGLASRAQLAMLIFEHQKTLDQGHLNVIHKQNDPHIEQMKPNMLK